MGVEHMLWSKRPTPKEGDRKLRCKVLIATKGNTGECLRPARRYACEKECFDLGIIDCCKNHARLHEKQGITMKLIDRRKKAQ
jgi:hypothetical protein